jgi:hypothetical protein
MLSEHSFTYAPAGSLAQKNRLGYDRDRFLLLLKNCAHLRQHLPDLFGKRASASGGEHQRQAGTVANFDGGTEVGTWSA